MSFALSLYQANPNAIKAPSEQDVAWWDSYRATYGDAATANAFNQAVANVTGTPVWSAPAPSPAPAAPDPAPAAPSPAPAAPTPAPSPAPAPSGTGGGGTSSPAPAPVKAGEAAPPPGATADQWFPGVSNRTVTLGAALLVAYVLFVGGK